jgi:uncharacterized membrane protein
MNYEKDKENNLAKRTKRSLEILMHGFLITLVTYILYPQYFIKFGILHFLAVGTLLVSFLAPYKLTSLVVLFVIMNITYPKINSYVDLVTGAEANSFMMDWFPLNKWLPLLLAGLILGQNIPTTCLTPKALPTALNFDNFITDLGKNSLNLYTLHVVVLLVFYKL